MNLETKITYLEYIEKENLILQYLKEKLEDENREEILHGLCLGFGILATQLFEGNEIEFNRKLS